MRITFITSVTVAAAGTLQDALGFSRNVLSGNEPIWLVLWGVGLLALAGTLRTRLASRRAQRSSEHGTPVSV